MKRKVIIMLLFIAPIIALAQKEKELQIKISDIELENYEDKEFGISLKYPKGWQITKNIKKIGTKVTKDISIIKKPGYFDHISLSIIEIKKEEDFLKESKQYKDTLIRELTKNKEIGIKHKWITDEEKTTLNANEGLIIGFEYLDTQYIINRAFLYFLRKNKKIYVIELYFELGKDVKSINPKIKVQIDNLADLIFKNIKLL
ncbi:MAG TPA: hypothetical protein PKW55_08840 [Spirochaetota bacterium]|nr:hypothetical protein [Spirochaetota bacterium]HOM39182.1 hypothetical protein [Spirochaetota bacterium]HPQ50036.1 hypothetical protein [Spirochaetota bacterium]